MTLCNEMLLSQNVDVKIITSPPIGGGRGIVMPMSVCLFVCLFVRVFAKLTSPPIGGGHIVMHVCLFVCGLFVRVFAKFQCNISAISHDHYETWHNITYGYTVTDKYFQNFRSSRCRSPKGYKRYLAISRERRDSGFVNVNIIPTTFVFGILVYAL